MPNVEKPRVALALDLTVYLKRHTDIFAGAVRYAAEQDEWTCVIDDFVTHTLEGSQKRRVPYQGILGRATPQLAEVAKRRRLPLVNVWRSSPVPGLYGVYPDFARAGEMAAEHLVGAAFAVWPASTEVPIPPRSAWRSVFRRSRTPAAAAVK